ncbi:MAG: exonuclease domain-containing protein [Eubacterium sp.]|nr:exonuclease domain-containing protein [Eubacterium sp.]
MYYIIFDLEWNNAYNYAARKFMNEIIEIGAVKLDSKLNIVDTFKQLVIPEYTRKLSSRCKKLTNITNEEIKKDGISFDKAFREFSRWGAGRNNVFMSWSNSDLYVLMNNFMEHTGSPDVKFIKNYCDAQKYCMSFVDKKEGNQIGLANCAEEFKIDFDSSKLHRALADCYLTAECLKSVYDKNKIKPYINSCDKLFFERLLFKPYYITEPVTNNFSVFNVELVCPKCGSVMPSATEFTVQNKSFKTHSKCAECKKSYWIFIRAKQLFDKVSIKTNYIEMNFKKAKRLDKKPKN